MSENLSFKFTADISEFQNAIASVTAGLKSTGDKLKDIGGQLSTYVSLPLAALGTAAIKAFGDIQALKNGLTAVTGSASIAEKQFTRLKEIAKLPGLGLQEAVKGAINLQVIGFSAEKAEKAMMSFGNAVATVGKGKEDFQGALYGLQQLANTDLPLAEDLNIIKERIPQVTPLLKEAFGTARSDELAKMGITSAKLVDTIIDGLAKLPPVTGGINAAFENLGDGIKNNLADVGEIINNSFDISAIIDKVVSSLTELVNYFKGLSPEIQKTVVSFGALGVVLPPLLVAIGVFVGTILPALIAGFAALLSPIGLVVVAIAGAAVLIVENWDSVVKYFQSGEGAGIWDGIKEGASDLFGSLSDIFNSIKDLVSTVWNLIGTDLITITSSAFGELSSIISNVLSGIASVFKIFTSILKGDWAGFGEGLAGLTHAIWNGVVDIIKNALKVTASLLAGFFKLIGMETLGNSLTATTKSYDTLFNSIKFGADKATKAIQSLKKETVVEDETVITKPKGKTVTKQTAGEKQVAGVFNELAIGLKQIDAGFQTSFDEKASKKIDEYQKAIEALIKNGVDPLGSAIKNLKTEQLRNLQLPTISDTPSLAGSTGNQFNSKGQAYIKDGKSVDVKVDQTRPTDAFKNVTLAQQQLMKQTQKFNNDFNSLIEGGLGSSISDAFSSIGEAFGAGESVMAAFGASILKSFSGFLGKFGDLLIEYGTAAVLKGKLDLATLIPGGGIIAGGLAIAAGIALKLASGAFAGLLGSGEKGKNDKKPTAFANGGIVYGPTLSMTGEYSNAKNNPEVIAPLSKLKQMLPQNSGNNGFVSFEIEGTKLVGILKNVDRRNGRTY